MSGTSAFFVRLDAHSTVRSRASGNPGPLAPIAQSVALGPRLRGDERLRCSDSNSSRHALALEIVENRGEGCPNGAHIPHLLLGNGPFELHERLPQIFACIAAILFVEPLGARDEQLVLGLLARMHLDMRQRRKALLELGLAQPRGLAEDPRLLDARR